MTAFMTEDFLLTSDLACRLFHEHAERAPIYDYHNHLSPKDIFEKRRFENLGRLWLESDHYKWRCMRVCGVAEKYITGGASDWEKFYAFAQILPRLIGSPVYHWAHLELQRYFGIFEPLNAQSAERIWQKSGELLAAEGFDCAALLGKMNVRVLCTTDDPADDLVWHERLAAQPLSFRTLPSFRPDRFLNIDRSGFAAALGQLGARYGAIDDWDSLCAALRKALDFFCARGCRVTDHGFLRFRYAAGDGAAALKKALAGEALAEADVAAYQGALLRFLGAEYARRGLVMQLHLGPMRNNSPKLMAAFGADAGGDSIGLPTDPFLLSAFLGDLERAQALPKTILYNLNPADNAVFSTLAADFAADGARVQYGAAWWLLDHRRGIEAQLDELMETGLLSSSVGMLTDSRAVTSFVRHEYYRRIVCQKLAALVERGEYPPDEALLGSLVEDLCFRNAQRFFGFE